MFNIYEAPKLSLPKKVLFVALHSSICMDPKVMYLFIFIFIFNQVHISMRLKGFADQSQSTNSLHSHTQSLVLEKKLIPLDKKKIQERKRR